MTTFPDLVQTLTAASVSSQARDAVKSFISAGGSLTAPELRSLLDGSCGGAKFSYGSDKATLLTEAAPGMTPDTSQADFEALLDEFGMSLMSFERENALRNFDGRGTRAAAAPPPQAAAVPDLGKPESTPLVGAAAVREPIAVAVAMRAGAGEDDGPSLATMAERFRADLGVQGNIPQVVDQACKQLGVQGAGLSLPQKAQVAWERLYSSTGNGSGGASSVGPAAETMDRAEPGPAPDGSRVVGPMVLVNKGDPMQCVFKEADGLRRGEIVPLTLSSHEGRGIGTKFDRDNRFHEWRYRESVVCGSALRVRKEGDFIQLYGHDLVLDVSFWKYEVGNTVNFVGGSSPARTRLEGGGRSWTINANGTVSPTTAPHLVLGTRPAPDPNTYEENYARIWCPIYGHPDMDKGAYHEPVGCCCVTTRRNEHVNIRFIEPDIFCGWPLTLACWVGTLCYQPCGCICVGQVPWLGDCPCTTHRVTKHFADNHPELVLAGPARDRYLQSDGGGGEKSMLKS